MSRAPMRVLLVRTSATGAAFRAPSPPAVTAPLGVLYLAAALHEALGDRLAVEVESLSTAVATLQDLPAFLAARRPHLLGISSSMVEEREAVALVEAARALDTPPVVVLGGPYPTAAPQRALQVTAAAYAVLGEGERTAVALIRALLDGDTPDRVPGVAWLADGELRTGGPVVYIDDLDAVPHPAWERIDIERFSALYNFNDLPLLRPPHVPITTSRGCPYRCSYCHNVFGRRFRARSATNVLEELELLHDRHGVNEIHVVDDIFNFDGHRVEAIAAGIRERGLDLALAFPNGVRGDLFTRRQLELLREAGAYSITVALESASPRILERMGRTTDLDRLARNVQWMSELGMIVSCFVMFGYPGETRQDLEQTIRWIRDSHVDFPRHAIASPFPGTRMAEHARAEGLEAEQMEVGRASYDWDNRGLARMSPRELKARVHEGLDEVMAETRRRRRLDTIWSRWGPADLPYFGYKPPRSRHQ